MRRIHPENAGVCLSPARQLQTWGCIRSAHENCSHLQFFLSRFSFTNIYESHDCRGRRGAFVLSRTLTFQQIFFIYFNDSPSKMMKNAYFILKALFVLKIFKFSSWLFGHVEKNSLMRKTSLNSKFMTSQPG